MSNDGYRNRDRARKLRDCFAQGRRRVSAPVTLAGGTVIRAPGQVRRFGCDRCGDPLTPTQRRWCSDRCRFGYPKDKGLH
jgi:hypothetical protein